MIRETRKPRHARRSAPGGPPVGRGPVLAVVALAVVALGVGLPNLAGLVGGSASPSAAATNGALAPSSAPPPLASGPSSAAPAAPTPTPTPTPTPAVLVEAAVVPVTHFRSPAFSVPTDEVPKILAGTSTQYRALALLERDADGILASLGIERPAESDRFVLAADVESLSADLAATRDRLAFIRAEEVGPGVRALAWGDAALFGVERATSLEGWPLTAQVPEVASADAESFDPGATWTLVAGGDMMLDRGVAQTVKVHGKGVDFPFDGGTAEITSRYCCSSFGWELPRVRRTGNEGAMRALLRGADLAIANFENPAPNNFRYHTSGTVFSADPRLIDGLVNAGLDYVSLANNHIRDAGARGVLETIENLEQRGLAHSGAGANIAEARRPAMLEANGVTVAILAYDTIAGVYTAGPDRAGSARLTADIARADIAAAREAGADVVIVFPHWGTEYKATPFKGQQNLARATIEAGADMVIGNHAHWAGALEVHDGRPIWYALGNFVFDQTWSEPTMEGITLELTFDGADLVQAWMRPHIILDKAQPNFLAPNGDGRIVLGQVFGASRGLLDW